MLSREQRDRLLNWLEAQTEKIAFGQASFTIIIKNHRLMRIDKEVKEQWQPGDDTADRGRA